MNSRGPDPAGVSIVRVAHAVCANCGEPAEGHGCGLWRYGGIKFLPDRPVPVELKKALA